MNYGDVQLRNMQKQYSFLEKLISVLPDVGKDTLNIPAFYETIKEQKVNNPELTLYTFNLVGESIEVLSQIADATSANYVELLNSGNLIITMSDEQRDRIKSYIKEYKNFPKGHKNDYTYVLDFITAYLPRVENIRSR